MIEEDISRLIELNEKIVSQNDEIIRLLSKLAGEDNNNDDNLNAGEYEMLINEGGDVFVHSDSDTNLEDFDLSGNNDKVDEEVSDVYDQYIKDSLDLELDVGEVLFVGNSEDGHSDIYKLTIKNSDEFKVYPKELEEDIRKNISDYDCEITIDNLTGDGITNQYNIPLIVANESLIRNSIIDSSIVILDDESFDNLPDMVKVAIEYGMKKIHLSLKNAMAVISAPPHLMEYLEFYKNYEQILDKLF